MNWSKDKAARFEDQLASDEARRWKRAWITTLVAVLLLVAAITTLISLMRGNPQDFLETARRKLAAANNSEELSTKLDYATQARDAAERASALLGDSPTASLLIAGALAIRKDDPHFLVDETYALNDARSKIDPSKCKTFDLLQAGTAFFYSGDNILADQLLTEAFERDELRAEVLNPLIQVRYDRGDEDSVLALGEELAKLEPENCLPWVAMSYVFEDRQALEQLIATYRELLKRDCAEQDLTRWKLIERLIEVGLAAEAQQEWDKLAESFPEVASAKGATLAKLLFLQGKIDETQEIIEEILRKNPESLDAILLRGQIATAKDKPLEAIQDFEKLREVDPTHPQVHYLLGQAYAKAGMREEATQELALHEKLSTALVTLHGMERYAAKNTNNAAIRLSIAAKYEELGLLKIAEYWRQQASAIQSK
ncbi:hypothetical protein DTL42_09020 [Bremerella cremea]|uniref:Tetratricopeptide repeat protein n=1 Tax=Bremerella cremea TaxID=1031537 RepID=A0A368KTP4_9BACT|nr:tetratricopeptide repeat protein [Bremerella cremea]RCS52948.1 hypothetical protein DTL42_09020 [Bremerella cremea]